MGGHEVGPGKGLAFTGLFRENGADGEALPFLPENSATKTERQEENLIKIYGRYGLSRLHYFQDATKTEVHNNHLPEILEDTITLIGRAPNTEMDEGQKISTITKIAETVAYDGSPSLKIYKEQMITAILTSDIARPYLIEEGSLKQHMIQILQFSEDGLNHLRETDKELEGIIQVSIRDRKNIKTEQSGEFKGAETELRLCVYTSIANIPAYCSPDQRNNIVRKIISMTDSAIGRINQTNTDEVKIADTFVSPLSQTKLINFIRRQYTTDEQLDFSFDDPSVRALNRAKHLLSYGKTAYQEFMDAILRHATLFELQCKVLPNCFRFINTYKNNIGPIEKRLLVASMEASVNELISDSVHKEALLADIDNFKTSHIPLP